MPIIRPTIVGAALIALSISLDDFVITFFVAGAGASTLPIYIYTLIRVGISPEVNAVSAMMLIVSIVFVSLSFLVARRR